MIPDATPDDPTPQLRYLSRRVSGSFTARRRARAVLREVLHDIEEPLLRPDQCPDLGDRIERIATGIIDAVGHDPDAALFELQSIPTQPYNQYSLQHAARCAIVSATLAQGLEWSPADTRAIVCAALTMNLSITRLQGDLAGRGERRVRPTAEERESIARHPHEAAQILRQAGVSDPQWLAVIEQHHELPGGAGYPGGIDDPGPIARTLGLIDVYLAKLAPRASRPAVPIRWAAKQMLDLHRNERDAALAVQIVRHIGVYPVGTRVRLANGEIGVVYRRSQHLASPFVKVMQGPSGAPLSRLELRDTHQHAFQIAGVY